MLSETSWPVVVAAVAACFAIGFWIGCTAGRRQAGKVWDAAYAEGHYTGWVERHNRLHFVDDRLHPDAIGALAPSVLGAGQEYAEWMRDGDHQPFEQWRAERVAALNAGLSPAS